MKNIVRCFLIVCILGLSLSALGVTAAPVVEDITPDPSVPTVLSTIAFTANVSGDNISAVHVIVKECNADICYFPPQNTSMDELPSGEYEAEVTLIHSDAIYIGYWLVIKDDGVWYNYEDDQVEVYLDLDTDNGQTGGSKDKSDSSPGFELILLITSIALLISLYRRKRR